MEIISYNSELAIANLQFKRLFSNIQIHRSNPKTSQKQIIPVTCTFEQRSRILKNWENSEKRATYKLPMIIINRTGYSRNGERLNDLHNEVKYEITSKTRKYDLLTPVPIDIQYQVSIMAKYPSDIDQIASNFMIFFNNDTYVQCMHPKYEGLLINNQIVMDDSITEEHSGEIDGNSDDFITSSFSFTFKTYLFGGTEKAKLVPSKILSTWLSTYTQEGFQEIPYNKIDEFQQNNPNSSVYAYKTNTITEEVTGYVDNPDISSYTYDGFVPIINKLCIGFYPTPYISSHENYMYEVDNVYKHENYDVSSYYSSCIISVNEEGLSVPVEVSSWYEKVMTNDTIETYVDRINWTIDSLGNIKYI